MSFRVDLRKLARNSKEVSSTWKFNDPDYPQFQYTLSACKLDILNDNDCLWKIGIQSNEMDEAYLDIISIQFIDSCDEESPNFQSKLYNLRTFCSVPFTVYQNGLSETFASNWNGYVILQVQRFYVIKAEFFE